MKTRTQRNFRVGPRVFRVAGKLPVLPVEGEEIEVFVGVIWEGNLALSRGLVFGEGMGEGGNLDVGPWDGRDFF